MHHREKNVYKSKNQGQYNNLKKTREFWHNLILKKGSNQLTDYRKR